MSAYLDWKVGDSVVCVEAAVSSRCKPLVLGKIYTIREVFVVDPGWLDAGIVGVLVEEIRNIRCLLGPEHGYRAYHFRKVQPRKTDIAILERFLNDADAPIREEV